MKEAYYHGKDFVHRGTLLVLNPEKAWSLISSYTRRNIKRAKKLPNLEIRCAKGNKEDVEKFRKIWFNPDDPTLPSQLDKDQIMYLASINKQVVAGMILTPIGKNLFLHNLGGNERAKSNNVTGYLLWNAVEDLKSSGFHFIDIGVSFRKSLQTFFKHWRTEEYPIIFEPPQIKLQINLKPFFVDNYRANNSVKDLSFLKKYFGSQFTILPDGTRCLEAILIHLNLSTDDNIAIFKTFKMSGALSETEKKIKEYCLLSRKINKKTKAAVIIHEYGYVHGGTKEIKKECDKKGIPLIEDCGWIYNEPVNLLGSYAFFGLQEIFPMQYGGVLWGLSISDEENWNKYRLLDYYKREIVIRQLYEHLPKIKEYNYKKRENFEYLSSLFKRDGYSVFDPLDNDSAPVALLVKISDAQQLYKRYSNFGVEVVLYSENHLLLPVHQNLSKDHLDYIYAIFRGFLNLCSGYKRKDGTAK